VAWEPGIDSGGRTGGAIDWSAEFERNERIYVPSVPTRPGTPAGAPIMAKAIHGLSITIPMWIPLALTIIPTLLLPIAMRVRVRLRAARGQCRACGYDLGGVPGPCPECGTLVRRVLRWMHDRAMALRLALR